MKAWTRLMCVGLIALSIPMISPAADAGRQHLYACRSPLLAFNFWNALQDIRREGVTLTPKIAQEICDGMKAGDEPQCIRIEGEHLKPVASGWQGAMAISDGRTKVWFHNPDALGWVHPDYYVLFVNTKQ
ncbi:hypothetical protein [Burkholderia ubonensis]|uniref:hypothetical protein n=1 Tax=Burkholderia ubonensis TaxID=101571 RepID=UPI0012FA6AAF|nr:hypothetical protein [Burkholderia ubonensis]